MAVLASPHADLSDRNIFDNRVEGDHLGEIGFVSSVEARREYYDIKFRYYTERTRSLRIDLPEVDVGAPQQVSRIWDESFAEEMKAYLLRVVQCPRDLVHHTWYNDLPAFKIWSDAVNVLVNEVSTRELSATLGTEFPVNLEEERLIQEQCGQLHQAVQEAAQASVASDVGIRSVLTYGATAALSEIVAELGSTLATRSSTLDELLTTVVRVVAHHFHVRVCDYLTIAMREGEPRLDLLASSWTASGGDIEKIRSQEAAYRRSEGISGSVFLLEHNRGQRWVGTNQLELDPRQGVRHADIYKSVYGDTQAFLVLPVFEGGDLTGALRVIDREVSQGLPHGNDADGRPGLWPLSLRADLVQVTAWLGSTIPLLREGLADEGSGSILSEVARYRGAWLSSVPSRYASSLLSECARVASMRSEHRSVGCTIAVGSRAASSQFKEMTLQYPSVPE